jgi:hypothetical protein
LESDSLLGCFCLGPSPFVTDDEDEEKEEELGTDDRATVEANSEEAAALEGAE